ncbi:MAG: PAS domain S-box protein, partial [Candidatus Eisenbacteria bacterium]
AAEVIGRSFVDFVHPEEVEQARTNMAALLAGTEMEAHEYRLRFKSGENRWVRISSRPIRTDGAVTGVRGVITDIHDLKTAQFALEEADAIRQALAEHASDGIAIIEGERFRFANRTLCEMLGYTAEELAGKPVIDFIPPENHEAILARTRQDLAAEKTLRYGPLRVVCKDGTEKMIEFDGAVIRYHGRPAVIGLTRDVTAQSAGEGKR